jgi:hypothetical protein
MNSLNGGSELSVNNRGRRWNSAAGPTAAIQGLRTKSLRNFDTEIRMDHQSVAEYHVQTSHPNPQKRVPAVSTAGPSFK